MDPRIPSPAVPLPIEFGNAQLVDTQGTGWIVGFSEWVREAPHELRFVPPNSASRGLCLKWGVHAAGDPWGQPKPVSTGRTMSVLVSAASEFRIEFCVTPGFEPEARVTHVLRRAGDFVAWGAGLYHRAFGVKAATVLTLRWQPEVPAE